MDIYEQLEREEGVRYSAYQDRLGYWTIGVGRLIDARKGGCLSREEVQMLLRNDVTRCMAELISRLPWFGTLNEPRQAVLIGMAFQMGVDGLMGFKNTLAKVQAGDYSAAAEGMLNSRWAAQTPARAHRMARQMQTGDWSL